MAATETDVVEREQVSSPRVDFVIVADRAEAINGKLYMMGGAWDSLRVIDFGQPVQFFIALGIVIPWTAANDEVKVQLLLQSEDGRRIEEPAEFGVIVGRPPHATRGQSFRAVMAAEAKYKLPGPGAYELVASIMSGETKRTVFYALQAQALMPVPPPQSAT